MDRNRTQEEHLSSNSTASASQDKRRREARIPLPDDLRLRAELLDHGPGYVQDISASGLGLQLEAATPSGLEGPQNVQIHIPNEPGNDEGREHILSGTLEIRHLQDGPEGVRVGGHFTPYDSGQYPAMDALVSWLSQSPTTVSNASDDDPRRRFARIPLSEQHQVHLSGEAKLPTATLIDLSAEGLGLTIDGAIEQGVGDYLRGIRIQWQNNNAGDSQTPLGSIQGDLEIRHLRYIDGKTHLGGRFYSQANTADPAPPSKVEQEKAELEQLYRWLSNDPSDSNA